MELLVRRDCKEIWFNQIERPFTFETPFADRRYVAIVFSNDETVTSIERQQITDVLFSSGCRYGLFAGHACRDWELSLDIAFMKSDPDYQPSDEKFTMTTSHVEESIEDIIYFGLMNTSFDAHDFDRFLILFVGPRIGLRDEVELAIRLV